ncbi:hypothetical protein BpHYR1_014302 [Brachionus plicatilis]|uniref:Uncharacterized protein n=1 Tax=Brachionus plicatilis TaxID=10195 RepID=A0A3M7R5P3_BRAPC|nr:hypothetical protein BpHYR1_014302 [Brachionus plicatilis]
MYVSVKEGRGEWGDPIIFYIKFKLLYPNNYLIQKIRKSQNDDERSNELKLLVFYQRMPLEEKT